MPLKAVSVWETKKRYSGEEKGFVEEMRFVAMKLHTRDQAKEGEKEDPDVQPLAKWEPSIEGYIRFLVDSKVVYDTLESIVNKAAYPVYAEFRNTGLERSEKLSKDLEWFKEQGHAIPEPSSPGTSYASYLKELAEKLPPAFICHFYNVYFAHTAGGRMIGKKVAGKILDSKQLEFYKWDGDFSQLLQNAREKLNRVTQEILNILIILCSTSLVLAQLEPNANPVFNVVNYGAVGDGKADDSQAFTKAWAAMCTARGALPTIVFPSGKTFLLKPIAVSGPCTSPHVHVQVSGNLVGPSTIAEWQDATEWLRFTHVEGLTVDGPGLIGGQGPMWWPCRTKPHVTCQKPAPTALYFGYCNDLRLDGLHLHNNPRNHISLLGCNGGVVSNLVITAPGDSPNTDGIDIQDTKDLQIYNSTIATGDDCIAILNNTCNVNISYVICGPGHGISIGSLGKEGGLAMVEQIHLFHCTFKDTTNGARIKTWETGTGYVRDISYQDLIMDRVQNPIFIDQNYNPNPNPTSIASQIKVSGVQFNGVRGTSSEQQAVKVECSPAAPCTNVVLKDVSMAPATPGENLTSVLFNAQGQACCNCNPPVFC